MNKPNCICPVIKHGKALKRFVLNVTHVVHALLNLHTAVGIVFGQLELAKGTSPEELKNNQYYDEKAIEFVETICRFRVLDGAHRFVVRNKLSVSLPLSLGNNLRLIICYNCTQACRELRNEKDPNAPTRVMCAVVDGDEEANTLWYLSWALNTLGHSIVKINTFDWILAVKHARAMM